MAPSDPLYLAWAGVNRITPSGRVAAPEQRISVDVALRAITIEAAYSWRKEDLLGSIKAGKIANLTVLEQDPYQVDPKKLKDIPVWGTVFEGKVYPVLAENKRALVRDDGPVKARLATLHHHGAPLSDPLDPLAANTENCQLGVIAEGAGIAYAQNLAEAH